MDDVLTNYIIHYYPYLCTMAEQETLRAISRGILAFGLEEQRGATGRGSGNVVRPVSREVAETAFYKKVAERILTEHKDEVFLNYCPVCGRLARTPRALQCQEGHRWTDSRRFR